MKKIICLIFGHKMTVKLQVARGYTTYICDRCGNVFAKKANKTIQKPEV